MGQLISVLSSEKSAFSPLYQTVRIESAECIHFHWRNLRLLLSVEQFGLLRKAVHRSGQVLDTIGFIERKGDGLVFDELELHPCDNEISVELNKGQIVHVHCRDLRIEMKKEEFLEFADCLTVAAQKLRNGEEKEKEEDAQTPRQDA